MDRRGIMPRGVLGALSLFLASYLVAPAMADPIRPWAGAKAEVRAADQWVSNRGPAAYASAEGQGEVIVSYDGYTYAGQPVRGSGTAEATGNAESLLRVGSSYGPTWYGTRPQHVSRPPYQASAEWTGEALTVRPALAGSIPESVRLNIGFDFSVNAWYRAGHLLLEAGNKKIDVDMKLSEYMPEYDDEALFSSVSSPVFDTLVIERDELDPYFFLSGHGTLHLDLLLDKNGRSDPFSLLLASNAVPVDQVSNGREMVVHRDFTLSLLDLTLPDGTPLHEAGYSVAFDSGLAWPQPVPEPAPIALLGAGMALAGWKRWRKRGGA